MSEPATIHSILREKAPRRIKTSEFSNRRHWYWAYQYCLANHYLCRILEDFGFSFEKKEVLDIGCGIGGFAAAVLDRGASTVVGIDIVDLEKPYMGNRPFQFILGDMNDQEILKKLDKNYDLVIVRDVIEHIATKDKFLRNILSVLSPEGKIFITFPPYYSPYGGHTQNLRTGICKIPYLQILPKSFYESYICKFEPPSFARDEILRLNDIRTTVRGVEKLFSKLQIKIVHSRFYALRPTFHIRYGIRPVRALWGKIPFIQEFTTTAVFYYLGRSLDVSEQTV